MDKKKIVGIFADRIPGEDKILELQKTRYEEMGIGAEMYCRSPEHLEHLLKFKPDNKNITTAHPPYESNLVNANSIGEYADNLYGLIVHDHAVYYSNLNGLKDALNNIRVKPTIFIEYSAFASLDQFRELFELIKAIDNISICLDTGHLALRIVYDIFKEKSSDNIFDYREDGAKFKDLEKALPKIKESVKETAPRLVDYVASFAGKGKPIHLHIHDAHPLSKTFPNSLSDHQSFFGPAKIKLNGQETIELPKLIGIEDLKQILSHDFSVNIEVHPDYSREDLGIYKNSIFKGADPKLIAGAEIVNASLTLVEKTLNNLDCN